MPRPDWCPAWRDNGEHLSPHLDATLRRVAQEGCECWRAEPASADHVRGWHRESFLPFVPLEDYAGNFRQVSASSPCLEVFVGVGVPGGKAVPGLPPADVSRAMNLLVAYVTGRLAVLASTWSQLAPEERVRSVASLIGTAIGSFIKIHPFVDGNGRTSRVLWSVLLGCFGIPPQWGAIKRPGGPYADAMDAAMRGDNSRAVAMVFASIAAKGAQLVSPR